MKFYNISDIDGFFEEVGRCKGQVLLVSEEGDRLNLKSKLARVIAYANVFSKDGEIPEMEILTSEPDDMRKLMDFVITGDKE